MQPALDKQAEAEKTRTEPANLEPRIWARTEQLSEADEQQCQREARTVLKVAQELATKEFAQAIQKLAVLTQELREQNQRTIDAIHPL